MTALRPYVVAGLVVVALLIGGLGAWLTMARIAGAVIGHGTVTAGPLRHVVQHPQGGTLARLAVREGDRVARGALLLRLDGADITDEIRITETRLAEALAQAARLEAERDERDRLVFDPLLADLRASTDIAALRTAQADLFAARQAAQQARLGQLQGQIAQIADQIAGLRHQQRATAEQQALIAQELDSQQALLERGLAQAARVLALRREAARLRGLAGQLAADLARGVGQTDTLTQEIATLTRRPRDEALAALRELHPQLSELRTRRATLLRRRAGLDLRAPVAGVVQGLAVTGPVIRPAVPLMELIPTGAPPRVTVRLRPDDIDRVRIGQPVRLKPPGADDLGGHVVGLSADTLRDAPGAAPYYRVEVAVAAGAEGLRPGLPVEAFFQTAPRSPLRYLLEPLTTHLDRALREG